MQKYNFTTCIVISISSGIVIPFESRSRSISFNSRVIRKYSGAWRCKMRLVTRASWRSLRIESYLGLLINNCLILAADILFWLQIVTDVHLMDVHLMACLLWWYSLHTVMEMFIRSIKLSIISKLYFTYRRWCEFVNNFYAKKSSDATCYSNYNEPKYPVNN